jgi:hypothetical protein
VGRLLLASVFAGSDLPFDRYSRGNEAPSECWWEGRATRCSCSSANCVLNFECCNFQLDMFLMMMMNDLQSFENVLKHSKKISHDHYIVRFRQYIGCLVGRICMLIVIGLGRLYIHTSNLGSSCANRTTLNLRGNSKIDIFLDKNYARGLMMFTLLKVSKLCSMER